MILTKTGRDIITINDDSYNENAPVVEKKVHLIRIEFNDVTNDKLNWLIDTYPLTNRYIINDNIFLYNQFFKKNTKKYYVENLWDDNIISFFKKNNKILLNFNNLSLDTRKYFLKPNIFQDILKNLEIIQIYNAIFEKKRPELLKWNGNVIIEE